SLKSASAGSSPRLAGPSCGHRFDEKLDRPYDALRRSLGGEVEIILHALEGVLADERRDDGGQGRTVTWPGGAGGGGQGLVDRMVLVGESRGVAGFARDRVGARCPDRVVHAVERPEILPDHVRERRRIVWSRGQAEADALIEVRVESADKITFGREI